MADDLVLDELYSLPIEEFTSARNDLAARLKDGGDSTGAADVKKLKKPTVAAWAVNQLARSRGDDLTRLMELREEAASGTDMRAAASERKKLIASLTDAARDILKESEHSPTAATMEGVSKTLLAGATEAERELIAKGRLTKELSPAGFEGAFGVAPAAEEKDVPEVEPRAARRAEDLAHKAEELEAEAAAAERAAKEAQKQADKLAQQAATARRKATEARHRADEALDAL